MEGYPDRAGAERLVAEAEACNPGAWGDHSRVAAKFFVFHNASGKRSGAMQRIEQETCLPGKGWILNM